jgi:uncharacterized membrane protein
VGVDLAVVKFDGEGTAVQRYAAAKERSPKDAPWTHEIGFVERHRHGHLLLRGTFAGHYLDVDESDHTSERGAAEGAVAGGLIGVLLGPPGIAVGLAAGAVVGSQTGQPSEVESEPQALVEQLRAAVPAASSAIVMIAPAADVEELLAALGDGPHETVRRTLSDAEVAALEASLSGAPRVSPEP